jgi:primosomal protein N' (replication factor Y)
VRAGTIVRVGLAGRRVGGWVVAVGPPDPDVPAAKLRPLAKVTGHGPSADVIELAAWASRRWAAGRLRPFLLAASPPRAVPALPSPAETIGRPEPVDAGAPACWPAGEGSCAGRRARTRSWSSWPQPRSVRPSS